MMKEIMKIITNKQRNDQNNEKNEKMYLECKKIMKTINTFVE